MVKYSDDQIVSLIIDDYADEKVVFLAPLVKGRKGHYRELFERMLKKGFTKVRVDGVVVDMTPGMKVDRYKVHDIEVVVDRLKASEEHTSELQSRPLLVCRLLLEKKNKEELIITTQNT